VKKILPLSTTASTFALVNSVASDASSVPLAAAVLARVWTSAITFSVVAVSLN